MHRADLAGAFDVVDLLELHGHLAELLRPDRAAGLGQIHPQPAAFGLVVGFGDPSLELA